MCFILFVLDCTFIISHIEKKTLFKPKKTRINKVFFFFEKDKVKF